MWWTVLWLLVLATTYDLYRQANDIRCILILLIPLVLQSIDIICDVLKRKYESQDRDKIDMED